MVSINEEQKERKKGRERETEIKVKENGKGLQLSKSNKLKVVNIQLKDTKLIYQIYFPNEKLRTKTGRVTTWLRYESEICNWPTK